MLIPVNSPKVKFLFFGSARRETTWRCTIELPFAKRQRRHVKMYMDKICKTYKESLERSVI